MWVQLLHLVRGLRAAGIFTAVAVTRPFLFEGPKKRQAADVLTAQLQECAHLVAIIDQVPSILRAILPVSARDGSAHLEGPSVRDCVRAPGFLDKLSGCISTISG